MIYWVSTRSKRFKNVHSYQYVSCKIKIMIIILMIMRDKELLLENFVNRSWFVIGFSIDDDFYHAINPSISNIAGVPWDDVRFAIKKYFFERERL